MHAKLGKAVQIAGFEKEVLNLVVVFARRKESIDDWQEDTL